MTATVSRPPVSRLTHLRQNIVDARETYGRRSSQAQQAFEMLVREAAEAGAPLDGLRRHAQNETERFFAYTVNGTDGHVYWDGKKSFRRNDGKYRSPRRWWWAHTHDGQLTSKDDLAVRCGETNCINPEHCEIERLRGVRIHWTQERIIGAIQVATMRLGHTPTSTEWEKLRLSPTDNVIRDRFGDWAKARAAAGVEPPPGPTAPESHIKFTREELIAGIQLVHQLTGRWPTVKEYNACRHQLHDAGLPRDADCCYRLFGSWVVARKAAGCQ